MTTQPSYLQGVRHYQRPLLLASFALACALLTVATDYLYATWEQSSFFVAESLLFSSFWLCFLPFLHLRSRLGTYANSFRSHILYSILATGGHLLLYPALVWLLSACLYEHTFAYWQTFRFGTTAHFIKAMLIYGLSYPFTQQQSPAAQKSSATRQEEKPAQNPVSSILVSDSAHRKTLLATDEIMYVSANPPYVNIFHTSKKYLITATLKSMESRLHAGQFVRIHKSCLVNIHFVKSWQSRLNGDYDLTLLDDTILRVSRNYAPGFKARLDNRTRVAVK
jgi:hypothetical protein